MGTITRGTTYGSTETITNAKLHILVDDATVTGIVNADVSAGAAIAASKLNLTGSGYVTTGANNDFTGNNTFAGTHGVSGVSTFTGDVNSSGGFNLTSTSLTDVLGLIYPVGMVITLGVSTNPATLLGIGTWTAITGKVIVGIDSGTFTPLDATGGAETVTLSVAHLPAHTHGEAAAHTHTIPLKILGGGGAGESIESSTNAVSGSYSTGSAGAHTHTSVGSGTAHANLQPYIVKFVWQRVS